MTERLKGRFYEHRPSVDNCEVKQRLWKAITFFCGYLSLCGVFSSLCGVVSSLCGVVTSLCLVFTSLCLVVTSICGLFIM